MSSPNHPTSDIEDAFSSNSPNYTPASPDYSPASPGNTPSESSNNSYGLVPIASPTLSLFPNDSYMKVMYAYDAIIPPQVPIPPPIIKQACTLVPPSFSVYTPTPPQIFKIGKSFNKMHLKHHEKQSQDILNYLEELSFHRIEKMEERLVNGWMIIQRDFDELKTKLEKAPKRISTSAAPAMNKAAIRQLINDRIAAALEAQAANMANTDNTNRNPEPRESHAARKCTYKEFMSCQPFYFDGTEGAVGLIRWFERTESDALSWWNSYANPIGIEQADKIAWTELKRLLTNKCCPRTKGNKMEDKFYNLVVKENDLKTYARRFQELAVLCPNMVSKTEKLMEVFVGGLPRSIEGNVTASKPQTLEEAINITQRLMD
uniref:Reverse transcriptase domain-containing protein n=1 Tax=Tanacetum cinerariifolium TaxID=118510 RepID=A0A6L2J499_TANCI|nr:reverse transcriptase domain-containing protein [Tanacetum cinerariifolium]